MREPLSPANKDGTIGDLFLDFDEEQLRQADEVLRDYLAFTVRMYDRIRRDPEAYARFKLLTAERRHRTMKGQGRLSNQ